MFYFLLVLYDIYYPVFQMVQEVQRLSHSVALAPAEGVHAYLGKGVYLIRLFDLIWHFLFLLKTAIITKYQVAFPFLSLLVYKFLC